MFQAKVVEKIKTHIFCWTNPPLRKSCRLWGNVEKYWRAGQVTLDNTASHAGYIRLQTHIQIR